MSERHDSGTPRKAGKQASREARNLSGHCDYRCNLYLSDLADDTANLLEAIELCIDGEVDEETVKNQIRKLARKNLELGESERLYSSEGQKDAE